MSTFRKLTIIAALLSNICICSAQEISVRGGFNLSQYRYINEGEVMHEKGAKLNPGFNVGPILEIPLKNMFFLETGLLFTTKGEKVSGDVMGTEDYFQRENLSYLEMPVLCKVAVPVRKIKFFAQAGPYIGKAIIGKRTIEIGNSVLEKDGDIHWGKELSRFDYGISFGAGVKYAKYQIGVSYEMGLKDIVIAKPSPERKNRVIGFNISYALINLKSTKK